jgi:hypothetical protein
MNRPNDFIATYPCDGDCQILQTAAGCPERYLLFLPILIPARIQHDFFSAFQKFVFQKNIFATKVNFEYANGQGNV